MAGPLAESAWKRHNIDNAYSGADGVRLGDANRDGHLDIATGWEEEGLVRLYLNPGPERVQIQWPAVTVGQVDHVEDAVFCDLDGDGALDIVSSCEGKTKSMFVHWAPMDSKQLLDETKWETALIPASKDVSKWMFALPADIDGVQRYRFVCGLKGSAGSSQLASFSTEPKDSRGLDIASTSSRELGHVSTPGGYQRGWPKRFDLCRSKRATGGGLCASKSRIGRQSPSSLAPAEDFNRPR